MKNRKSLKPDPN